MAAALATSARPFDLVIYGATGFTGYVASEAKMIVVNYPVAQE